MKIFPVLTASVLSLTVATAAKANPVCYMETSSGATIDLSAMCGDGQPTLISPQQTIATIISNEPAANLVVNNYDFDNEVCWVNGFGVIQRCENTDTLEGVVHNVGEAEATEVKLKATGYVENMNPQVEYLTIPRVTANSYEDVEFRFNFSQPVESWDIRVVSFE